MGLLKLQNTLLKNNFYIILYIDICINISQYFPPIYMIYPYVKCPINDSSTMDDVRGDFLGLPHGTTPAALKPQNPWCK